jgi:hypothetical protein
MLSALTATNDVILPLQRVNVNYATSNQGATNTTRAVLNESFDQVTPATASRNIGTTSAGQGATGTSQVASPSLSARQASERRAAYDSRLASVGNNVYTSSGELTFSDPLYS